MEAGLEGSLEKRNLTKEILEGSRQRVFGKSLQNCCMEKEE